MLKLKLKSLLICLVVVSSLMMIAGSFNHDIQPGFIAMVQKSEGLTGEVLGPGRKWIGFRDKIIFIEASEQVFNENMKILCSDDLNFSFDLKIRTQVAGTDGSTVKTILNNKGSSLQKTSGTEKVLPYKALYDTYVKPQARSIARGVVSQYSTTDIRGARAEIEKAIADKLKTSLKGTPVKITMVATSNFDYPEVITSAVERKREREIAIQEEKAKQAVKLLEANNRLNIAQKMRTVRAAEAQAEAAYMRIIGTNLNKNFLALKSIEAQLELNQRVGVGDKVIIAPSGSMPPILINK